MNKSFLPATILFLVVAFLLLIFNDALIALKVDTALIRAGNLLLFLVTLLTWLFHKKALTAGNSQAFLRNLYIGVLVKMFLCLTVLLVYISLVKKVNKPGLLIVMFLYLVYTFTEIAVLLKYSKRSKNV